MYFVLSITATAYMLFARHSIFVFNHQGKKSVKEVYLTPITVNRNSNQILFPSQYTIPKDSHTDVIYKFNQNKNRDFKSVMPTLAIYNK